MNNTVKVTLIVAALALGAWISFMLDLPVKRFCDAHVKDLLENERWFELIAMGLQDFAQYVPVIAILWAVWRLDRARGREVAVRLLVAVLLAGASANAMKFAVGRWRPFASDGKTFTQTWVTFKPGSRENPQQAFYSGHAAMALAMGKILSNFYPPVRPVVYTLAGGCAASRVLRDKHWLSDVYFGCLVGLAVGWICLPPELRRRRE